MSPHKVIWTDEALADLDKIFDFIAPKSTKAALKIIEKILSREKQLQSFPYSGGNQESKKRKSRYKYWVEGNYKIIYHVEGQVVYVDTVFDCRRDPEKMRI